MTFQAKKPDAVALRELDKARAAHAAMREHEAARNVQAGKRAAALRKANEHGLSLEALAAELGVTRQRVKQMISAAD